VVVGVGGGAGADEIDDDDDPVEPGAGVAARWPDSDLATPRTAAAPMTTPATGYLQAVATGGSYRRRSTSFPRLRER
jgi:hypothetical protein